MVCTTWNNPLSVFSTEKAVLSTVHPITERWCKPITERPYEGCNKKMSIKGQGTRKRLKESQFLSLTKL